MKLRWSARRQLLYYVVAVIILLFASVAFYTTFLSKPPTCSDGIQNGNEQGVDCGGSCALICQNTAKAPTVLWARAFKLATSTYTAAAYIQNNNSSLGAGAKSVQYVFDLYDSKNVLVAEREGVADIPPGVTVPIIELNINTGTREVARTLFSFSAPERISWSRVESDTLQTLRITDTTPYEDGSLSATVANNSFDDAQKVQVVAVLFDNAGIARAASKATIAKIPQRGSETITFTWPESIANIVRVEVTVLPSF